MSPRDLGRRLRRLEVDRHRGCSDGVAAFMDKLRPSVRRSFCAEVLAIAGTTSTGMKAADEAKAIGLLEHDDEVRQKVIAALNVELAQRDAA